MMEIWLQLLANVLSHSLVAYWAHLITRHHYHQKMMMLRYKSRILTGVDIDKPDERFPD